MSAFRTGLILSLFCLILSFGLFLFGRASDYEEYMSGYAVLSFNESIEDRVILELLKTDTESFSANPVSESSQWVILDNFESLETVPLNKFFSRVAPFDPRNDGYAEKLRDVFLQDGKRFIYIPLEKGNWTPLLLNKKLEALFSDIPFSAEYYGTERPLKLYFTFYAASSLCLLVILILKKYSRNDLALVALLLPVLSSLAFYGAAGIAWAALLTAFFIFYKEPIKELTTQLFSSSSFNNDNSKKLKLIYKEIIKPYRTQLFFLPVFAAALTVTAIFSQLKYFHLLAVFVCALAVFVISSRMISLSGSGRRRFTPVLIIKRQHTEFSFSFCILPFTAAAFILMIISPFFPGAYTSDRIFETVIDEDDYYAHLSFQSGFSTRRLGAVPGLDYTFYYFDEDGLPSLREELNARQSFNAKDFPAFPLRHLMDFFQSVNKGGKADDKKGNGFNLPVMAVLLLFTVPLFVKRKSNNASKVNIKRFSAIPRVKNARNGTAKLGSAALTDSSLSYNKYQPRIRKDA